jgi:hypothetical protein
MACCISFGSFLVFSYIVSCLAPCICKISSKVSSTTAIMRSMSSTVSTFFNWGLLVRAFFLVEGFSGEKFLFYYVFVVVRGSFGGVSSPSPFFSPSSPPSWFTSSPPLPLGESGLLSFEVLYSSSVSWTSSFFFFFFAFLCPVCSTQVTKGLPMISGSKSSAYSTGIRNFLGRYFVISSISFSISL